MTTTTASPSGGDFRLYTQGSLADERNRRLYAAKEKSAKVPADSLLNSTAEDIADSIAKNLNIEPVCLGTPKISQPNETPNGYISYQTIPFTGDSTNLRFDPSEKKGFSVDGTVYSKQREIKVMTQISESRMKEGPVTIKELEQMFAQNLDKLHFWVEAANKQISGFAEKLRGCVIPFLQDRREKLQNARASGGETS